MAELTLEMLRAEFAPVHNRLDALGGEITAMRADITTMGADVVADVAALRADVTGLRPNIDGIPLLQRAINTVHQEQRMMKAAINEIARTQFTSGEA